jgi:hypothetical protein
VQDTDGWRRALGRPLSFLGSVVTKEELLCYSCYIKNQLNALYVVFLLFHFTPTCFNVQNVIFRECTKSVFTAGRLDVLFLFVAFFFLGLY